MIPRLLQRVRESVERANGYDVEYSIERYKNELQSIHEKQHSFKLYSDSDLKSFSNYLKQRVKAGSKLDLLLCEAFALVRESVSRVLQQNAYDEQIIGGLAMYYGRIAEMQTGEGKTLAALFPAYLHAIAGKGVHVLTFNDYLVRRDAMWMGPVYAFLGLSTGFVQEEMGSEERKRAYAADISYEQQKSPDLIICGIHFACLSTTRFTDHLVQPLLTRLIPY